MMMRYVLVGNDEIRVLEQALRTMKSVDACEALEVLQDASAVEFKTDDEFRVFTFALDVAMGDDYRLYSPNDFKIMIDRLMEICC